MKKILYILSFGVLISSCNVLEQEPQSQITEDIIFSSEEGVNAAILGLYSSLQSDGLYGVNINFGTDQYADVTQFGGFFEEWLEVDNKSIPTTNGIVSGVWNAAYSTINLANIIISRVPELEFPGYEQAEKDEHIATAKTVRALCYFDLIRHFGEWWDSNSQYGVPVITQSSGGDLANVTLKARDNVSTVWNQILTDLNEASGSLPTAGEQSRIYLTQGFIDGMLARLYLYTGDMNNAIAKATELIDDPNYELTNTVFDVYSPSETVEDIFKLAFNVQDQSSLATFTVSREEILPENGLIATLAEDANDDRSQLIGQLGSNVNRILKYPDGANNEDPALVMRLAEMYLIRAEAYMTRGNAGDDVLAAADLNTIRARANAAPIVPLTPADLEDLYLDETMREMFGESYRYFALVRMGLTNSILGLEDFRRIYPIPFQELSIENTPIVQNPGYSN